ncbi:MAG: hypothetical protein IJ730_02835 [Alphaproteobacteria bacterium]|nr:hypothetical protein [Alphaproteobacteria bacterium]
MNKVVAILGVIVLLTLAILFFCVGFFTGSTVSPGSFSDIVSSEKQKNADSDMSAEAIAKKLGNIGDANSAKLSDKVMKILAAAGYTVENFSEIIKSKKIDTATEKSREITQNQNMEPFSVDALLREIAISHTPQDNCSYQKTMTDIQEREPIVDKALDGKKVVFIGYFKNAIAIQIQKLLTSKGYKTHVEVSKSSDGQDSFVFCGPFKKDTTANKLLRWLQVHNFEEARIVSITKEAVEETLYDAMNEGTGLPENDENITAASEQQSSTVQTLPVAPVVRSVPVAVPQSTSRIPQTAPVITQPSSFRAI